jgi:hypothetical protein
MLFLVGTIARLAIALGACFILGKTLPIMPNKVCRFVFSFVLGVPLELAINYVDVSLRGYHKTGWIWTFSLALFFATWLTFWPAEPHNSSTQ